MDGVVTGSRAPQGFRDHTRRFERNRYVYAVLSRRSRGISIGVNLNPDKVCNFDCLYCQVDRTTAPEVRRVDEARLLGELREMLEGAREGDLERHPRFADAPAALRRAVDVAFSGDGEPTSYPGFARVIAATAALLDELGLGALRMTVITNATLLHRPHVREGLRTLYARGGEIWAKLDAGTEAYYRRVCVTTLPLARVLENIRDAGREHPLVIQSLFLRLEGEGPGPDEIAAYAERLAELREDGCRIRLVQVYTVARRPADPSVTALADGDLEAIAAALRARCPGLPVEVHGAPGAPRGESPGRIASSREARPAPRS